MAPMLYCRYLGIYVSVFRDCEKVWPHLLSALGDVVDSCLKIPDDCFVVITPASTSEKVVTVPGVYRK